MQIEYEATFKNIDKDCIRRRLKEINAKLLRPEFLQKRYVFNLPAGHEIKGGWARVRDEGDKITMSIKIVDGSGIENQKEACLKVDNMEKARNFLKLAGFKEKAYQETMRELWEIDGAEVTIDEWPFLEPLVEIESDSEQKVRTIAEKLDFDYKQALFCSADTIYSKKYNLPEVVFTDQTPRIVFDMENPFVR